jgi:hypothetical protein
MWMSAGRAEFSGAWMAAHSLDTIKKYLTELRRFNMLRYAPQITCPTLILEAEHDFAGGGGQKLIDALAAPSQLVQLTGHQELTAIAAVWASRSGPRSSTTGSRTPSDTTPPQRPARRKNMSTDHPPADVSALTGQHQQQIPRPPHIAARRTPGTATGTSWRRPLILLILLATCGIAACSSSSSTQAPATTATTAPAATATTAPAATTAAPAATAAAASGDTIPEYKPSTVLSNASGATVLKSPDPVDKIAAFYENALKTGGWQWHTTAQSSYSTHVEATKDSAHAVIQVSSAGQGASISVTITT